MAGQDFTVSIVGNVTGFDVAPVNNLSTSLKTIPPAANQAASAGQQLSGSLNQVSTTSRTTGSSFQATGAMANAFGSNINTASGSARTMVGANSALGGSFGTVASGGLSANNALVPLGQNLQQTATHANTTQQASIGLGEKIALMGGFITTAVGSVLGLIEGFTGLEAAQVAADRAQQRVNTSELAAEKAQDNYNKVVRQFGPESKQAQEALANLTNKQEANRIAEERSEVTAKKLQEAYVSYALEIVSTVGELATMGSTVSILIGKLGLKTAATVADTEANVVNGASSAEAAIGLGAEGVAATDAAIGTEAAEGATAGLNLELIAIAAPLIAAAALFVLIETNTFGMGDAFRTVTPQIGSAIDAIVNSLAFLVNGFATLANDISGALAIGANAFISFYNAVNSTLATIVQSVHDFAQDFVNGLKVIYDFFVSGLVNPLIDAWNAFMKGLVTATDTTFGAVKSAMDTAFSGIVTGIELLVGNMNNALMAVGVHSLEPLAKSLADAKKNLADTGAAGKNAGQVIDTSFGQITHVKTAQLDFTNFNAQGLYPIIATSADVNSAFHVMDGAIIQNAGNIKTGAEGFLNYYSQGQNLAGGLKGALSPAIQQVSKYIQDGTTSIMGWIVPTKQAGEETDKFGGAMGKAQKTVKDFSTTLDESIKKQNDNSVAMLQSIASGQQYQKTMSDLGKALAEATVKVADLTTKVSDATAIQERHVIAVQEGIAAFLEWGIKAQDAATKEQVFNEGLKLMTDGFFQANPLIKQTAENMKTVGEAMLGGAEAAQKAHDLIVKAFEPLGNDMAKVVDDIAGKFEDLNKRVKKPFDDIPKYIQKAMTPEMKDFEVAQARMKQLGEQMSGQFGIALTTGGVKGALDFVQGVQDNLKNLGDKANLQPIIDDLQGAIANAGTPTGNAFVQKAIAALQALGPEGQKMAADLADKFGVGIDAGLKPVPGIVKKNVTDPFTGLPTTAQAVAQKIAKAFTDLGTAFDQLPGYFLSIFTRAFVTNLLTPLGKATTSIKSFINTTEVAFSGMVTSINSILAGIKMPVLTGPSLPNAPITGPVAPPPIKIPAPDLTAFEAGLAKMQTDMNNAFAAIVNIAKIQGTALAAAFTTAFNTATLNAGTVMNGLTINVQQNISAMGVAVAGFTTVVTTAFNAATLNAGTVMNGLTINVQQNIAAMSLAAATFTTALTEAFNAATLNAGTVMNGLAVNVQQNIANMIAAVNAFPIAVTTAFNTAAQNAAGSMNALAVNVQQNIVNMIAATNGFAIAITSNFGKGAQNAAGSMNALAVNEEGNIQNMIAATNAFAIAITSNFGKGAQNAAGSMNSLASNVSTNASNMVSSINRVVSAMNQIGSAASSARSQVQSLINSINSIPSNKTVNINIVEHRTVVTKIVPGGLSATGPTTINAAPITTLSAGIASALPRGSAASRRITVEVKEPTIIKINERELIRLINRKILELDLGALA